MNADQESHRENERLFLYIPIVRLILLSLFSFGLYEAYWIYKNWQFIKRRDGLNIWPFWRGFFGYFYCHSLLKKIHSDMQARRYVEPMFDAGGLATGWVVLRLLEYFLGRFASGPLFYGSFLLPSFLCLLPAQRYINAVTEASTPHPQYHKWSFGHFFCLGFGLLCMVGILWSEFTKEPPPEVSTPQLMTGLTFSLQHPSNWTVDPTDDYSDPDYEFVVHTKQKSAFMFFSILDCEVDVEKSIQNHLDAQLKNGAWSSEKVIREPAVIGKCLGSSATLKGVNYGIPITCQIFAANKDSMGLVVVTFYNDEDYDKIEKGFALVKRTFRLIRPQDRRGDKPKQESGEGEEGGGITFLQPTPTDNPKSSAKCCVIWFPRIWVAV